MFRSDGISNQQLRPSPAIPGATGVHIFQEVSSRSIRFLHRTFGATKRCLQQLCKKAKVSIDMTSLTDEEVIEFFTKERVREEKKNSLHGEVPDTFRTNHFYFTIEGENWLHTRNWQGIIVSARVYVKNKDSETFTHVLQTEAISGQCSPKFIARVAFNPLTMRNSQNHAMTTILRIDAYASDKRFASVHVSLAQLLWDMTYETPVMSYCPSIPAHRPIKASTVKLNLSRGRSMDEDIDECEIKFSVRVSRAAWTKAKEPKLFLAVCSVSGYGQWSRSYVSELLMKPSRHIGHGQFPTFKLKRGDLTCYNHNNPIRVELRGSQKGISKVYGFVQFCLPNISTSKYLHWNKTRSSRFSGSAVLCAHVPSELHSFVSLHIAGTVNEARELMQIAKEGFGSGGHERYLGGTDMISPLHKHSYDSSGSSSESIEPNLSHSLPKRSKKSLIPGPNYCVSFPRPL